MASFLDHTKGYVEKASSAIGIGADVLAILEKPKAVHVFEITLPMGKGETRVFKAWRVQHSDALGPFKGGIRFHPDANLNEVMALASLMTWKSSLVGIPYGGAKGAVTADSKALSPKELEAVSRSYVRKIVDVIGPKKDIPAPDVGTTPHVMAWMADEYAKLVGHFEPAAFTGKPVEIGGSHGRDIATGFGGAVVLREFFKHKNQEPKTKNRKLTVAIQGFGAVGSAIARLLFKEGYAVVGLSDSRSAIFEDGGIDVEELIRIREQEERGGGKPPSLEEAGRGKYRTIPGDELLEADVDVLVPAALESVITAENAGRIRARVVLEMANGPVTPEADLALAERGIVVIPDILANSGGVVGSYFEWVQGLARFYWEEDEVLARIEKIMSKAFRDIARMKTERQITWREAAYIRAVGRVAEAMRLRGWV